MEKIGLIVNSKKILRALILLVIGLSMMFYGVIAFYFDYTSTHNQMTDQEIIDRAKALGLVEPKEVILNTEE